MARIEMAIDSGSDFADTIELARRLSGMTQSALGEKLGVSAGRIGLYERGVNPPNLGTAINLLGHLGWHLVAIQDTQPEGSCPEWLRRTRYAHRLAQKAAAEMEGAEALRCQARDSAGAQCTGDAAELHRHRHDQKELQ